MMSVMRVDYLSFFLFQVKGSSVHFRSTTPWKQRRPRTVSSGQPAFCVPKTNGFLRALFAFPTQPKLQDRSDFKKKFCRILNSEDHNILTEIFISNILPLDRTVKANVRIILMFTLSSNRKYRTNASSVA